MFHRPHLPDEICETVIDWCHQAIYSAVWIPEIQAVYDVLLSCCLACRIWLPRSRLNLYSVIMLRTYDQVGLFLKTVIAHPFLADFVHTLHVRYYYTSDLGVPIQEAECKPEDGCGYVPFAHPGLVQNLRNLRSLVLGPVLMWDAFPPGYHRLISGWPITELRLSVWFQSLTHLFHLVWAFPNLERLHLVRLLFRQRPLSDAEYARINTLAAKRQFCKRLRRIEFEHDYTALLNFPPSNAFGDRVEELIIHWSGAYGPDDPKDETVLSTEHLRALQEYLAGQTSLQSLELLIHADPPLAFRKDGRVDIFAWITSLLSGSRTHGTLHSIHLCFWPWWAEWDFERMGRHAFLRALVTFDFRELVYGLPALKRLCIELPYCPGDTADDPAWWMRAIRGRLPKLGAEIIVVLRRVEAEGMPWVPFDEDSPENDTNTK
ncbi:hypothetical protein C8Q78DRAFT_367116 [Trametes maxima]|nr:hypothetical protein C8Q78DRAFT_367116 [Trametes maxima]